MTGRKAITRAELTDAAAGLRRLVDTSPRESWPLRRAQL
jgi:hypothetical protein